MRRTAICILAAALVLCLSPPMLAAEAGGMATELKFVYSAYPSGPSYYDEIEQDIPVPPPAEQPGATQQPGAAEQPDAGQQPGSGAPMDIGDGDTPLGKIPGFEIVDESTPLGNLPQTGFVILGVGAGALGLLLALSGAIGAGAAAYDSPGTAGDIRHKDKDSKQPDQSQAKGVMLRRRIR